MTTYNLHVVLLPRCITRCPLIGCHLTTRRCPFRNLLSRQTLRCNWLHLPRSHDGRSLKVCFGCSSVPSCHHQAELLSGTGWFWLSLQRYNLQFETPGLPRLPRLRDSRKTDGKSESNQSQVSQLSKPFSSSDSSLKMSAEGFCLLHKRMIHTNHGELLRIFDTYCRVWKAGGQATLTTSTEGGLLKANLDIQLG